MTILKNVQRYLVPRRAALCGWGAALAGAAAGHWLAGPDFPQRFAAVLAVGAALIEVVLGLMAYRLRSAATDEAYDKQRIKIARCRYSLALVIGGGVLGAGAYAVIDSPNVRDVALKVVAVYLAVLAAAKLAHSEHYKLVKLEHERGCEAYAPTLAWSDAIRVRLSLTVGLLVGAWILLSPLDALGTALIGLVLMIFAMALLREAVEDEIEPPSRRAGAAGAGRATTT